MRILAAVDLTDKPEQVVQQAVPWAERLGATLHLGYVSEWSTEGLAAPTQPTPELSRIWRTWEANASDEHARLDALLATVPEALRREAIFRGGRAVDVLPELSNRSD